MKPSDEHRVQNYSISAWLGRVERFHPIFTDTLPLTVNNYSFVNFIALPIKRVTFYLISCNFIVAL